ncbi:hypothetical protein KMW28_11035 [Flammeovirga yaeyamensis]|uniref:Uncharacterized protein n=1 Tax=Flammeovirga yaeyamensis TaxID=367791 RepID=A0AAX1N233_9BACT|nr:hypothetical protein [Flammeovirga yaeyamensis]MBB3696309.1 hypothetical protein [Flammeovirga yaeyamensis]NMF34988.1 hypothetical protein [Flammeovirga yaeyamensis]QWG00185.1 hypothetical protein KMW28_11035 [Flammeovirga yaeyamensis]
MRSSIFAFILINTFFVSNLSIAQQVYTVSELKDYYHKEKNHLPTPTNGWHEVWVIMPDDKDFFNKHQKEILDARVFVEDNRITKVYYDNEKYVENVFATSKVKKGHATFEKVYLDVNYNLTEIFSAHIHEVIFKDHRAEVQSPLAKGAYVGNAIFYSNEEKLDKFGFYVFVRDIETDQFDLIGYLKESDDEVSCENLKNLHIPLRHGQYEIFSVQNKIQFDRRMPLKKLDLQVYENECHPVELVVR